MDKEADAKEIIGKCLNCVHFRWKSGKGLTCTARRCPYPKIREWLKDKGVRWKF